MDQAVCVIRKNKSFCLLQTGGDALKFPQYPIPFEITLETDLLNDLLFPILRNKFGVDISIQGVISTKSVTLPHTLKRQLAFYILIEIDNTVLPPDESGDWMWHSIKTLEKKVEKGLFSSWDRNLLKELDDPKRVNNFSTVCYKNVLCQWTEDEIVARLSESQNKLRLSAMYDANAWNLFAYVYVVLTFPEPSMAQDHFYEFLKVVGVPDARTNLIKYFRAFDHQRKGRLSIVDFVLGCAALENHTTHGGEPGEQRCRYIFRYYCTRPEFNISFGEFVTMVDDILNFKMPKESKLVKDAQRSVLSKHYVESFSMNTFLQKVGSLQMRGTSVLFRSRTPVYEKLKETYKGILPATLTVQEKKSESICPSKELSVSPMDVDIKQNGTLSNRKAAEDMKICRPAERDYTLSSHVLQIGPHGTVVELLANIPDAISCSSELNVKNNSRNTDDISYKARQMLRALDYFHKPYVHESGKQKAAFDWHNVEMKLFSEYLLDVCQAASEIFQNEPRLLDIDDPVFVLGDLHGNVGDLFQFEESLWPLGPDYCPAKILFLGDYVDRGQYGVEVVTYLLSMKVLHPNRVFLLRGNHEIRSTQKTFQFYGECLEKFGTTLGELVFETINARCFDCLPLCSIINNKVFAVHGGIPSPSLLKESDDLRSVINKVPVTLDLDEQLLLPWQLLWNDPVWENVDSRIDSDGFGPNEARNTGMVFTAFALQNFLDKYHLSHVVRAHQVQQEGFQLRHSSKLLTVFSSSSYVGLDNNAACVLFERGNMRLVQIKVAKMKV